MAASTNNNNTSTATEEVSKPIINTRKPLYEGSTQFRRWRFSVAQLAQKRDGLNKSAVEAIKVAFETDSPGSSSNISFLTSDEELLLVKLYMSKITQLCGLFRFPEEVEATAVSYLKRFYLNNTVMDWHPKNVMLTALFLATKTTNHPISLETYTSHIPKTEPSDVLDLEFLVAQSLNFEFTVWHAHRALWGLYLDLQSMEESMSEVKEGYEKALEHIRASRLTDAELIYTPSQIAMGALLMERRELVMRWIRKVNGGKEDETARIVEIAEKISEMIIRDGVVADVEAVREVDKRLRVCKNPEKVVGSKAYLSKKAEEEARAKEKRERKVDGIKRRMSEDGDVFGDELHNHDIIDEDD